MGQFIGKVHAHDYPDAKETVVNSIWECFCGEKFRCYQVNGTMNAWGSYSGLIDVQKGVLLTD